MRIDNLGQGRVDVIKKDSNQTVKHASFSSMMQQSGEKQLKTTLNQLMAQIDEQGKQLSEKRTVDNLISYKKLVQKFLKEAANGLELHEKHSQHRHKTYKIIRTVDEKLSEIQKEVVERERSGVHLLSLVGEVKGLLVNLYL
jgi:uncharacterized protein